MKIQQIRNATLVLEYAGRRFLIDPMLSDKGTYPGFEGTYNDHLRNPLVELPVALSELVNVDAVFITHLHLDHWDEAAQTAIPKDIPIFAQNEDDAAVIRSQGFSHVGIIGDDMSIGTISIQKTAGQHGTDDVMAVMGNVPGFAYVCGLVFSHPEEKTLYIAGDTVWNDDVVAALDQHHPDVVVVNAGFAQIPGLGPIIMGEEDVRQLAVAAPDAVLVASHMEAVNHCQLTRAQLAAYAVQQGFGDRLIVPQDGETVSL